MVHMKKAEAQQKKTAMISFKLMRYVINEYTKLSYAGMLSVYRILIGSGIKGASEVEYNKQDYAGIQLAIFGRQRFTVIREDAKELVQYVVGA